MYPRNSRKRRRAPANSTSTWPFANDPEDDEPLFECENDEAESDTQMEIFEDAEQDNLSAEDDEDETSSGDV